MEKRPYLKLHDYQSNNVIWLSENYFQGISYNKHLKSILNWVLTQHSKFFLTLSLYTLQNRMHFTIATVLYQLLLKLEKAYVKE